ncbi:MAG TPA: CHAT domain-containing protein [Longimicrobium sp.]|nr:CHAT domain-containing protein [Longimicrobium sp.]
MKRFVPVLLAALVIVTAIVASLAFARRDPMRQLERATPERAFAPRLSVDTEYHGCTLELAREGNTLPRERCAPDDDEPPDTRLFTTPENSSDPDALRASALARMFWWDRTDLSLDEAIARLSRALRIAESPGPLLVDLSGAHLARVERMQNPNLRDLFVGLNFALEAVEREPGNQSALFNAALALQLLGSDEQAARAWDAYLAEDSASPWANEAHRRKRGLITHVSVPPEPGVRASQAVVDAYARQYPQEARELGWNQVLGEWGAALEGGHTPRADSLLELADRLGRALQRRPDGDASLSDAVHAIRAARGDATATTALARAHGAYADGQVHYSALEHPQSLDAFTRVVSLRTSSPVLLQWSALFRAIAIGYLGDRQGAVAALRVLLPGVDSARYPALAGRTHLTLATLLLRGGQHPQARTHLQAARKHFSRAGETELLGAALSTESETSYEQGDTKEAYRLMYRAMQRLRPYRQSRWLHNHLIVIARCAVDDGLPRVAATMYNEDLPVVLRLGTPLFVVESLLGQARARAVLGDLRGAAASLDSIAPHVARLPSDETRRWAEANLRFSRVVVGAGRDMPNAAQMMDSAVDYFASNRSWLIPALMRRADARLAQGNLVGASHDLERVIANIRDITARESNTQLRRAVVEQARSRFDQLVMLQLRLGQVGEALWTLERGRVSFAPQPAVGAGPVRLAAPPGHAALDYALVGDTLLAWVILPDSIHLMRRPLDRDTFLLAVEQANAGLESGENDATTRRALQRLYGWLIRPVRDRLGPGETPLVILADGEVAGVPFAALRDPERKRYLVEDHPLRFAATLTDAFRPAPSVPERAGPVLLVADPDFDRGEHPTLDRLRAARAEGDSLHAFFGTATLLTESAATRRAFVTRARTASIIHYAGHAVFDDGRPERSYLVLADSGSAGRLTAEAVHAMELRGAPLVVLSACRTLPSREGRSGGFAGFSGALLSAGARGVVGSLWQVHDDLTQPLMLAFHREHRRLGDPALALREAQLSMLHSRTREHQSPSAWAGFRYTGGLMPSPEIRPEP